MAIELKYFVLKPGGADAYAVASQKAMECYAHAIRKIDPELTTALLAWVTRAKTNAKAGPIEWPPPRQSLSTVDGLGNRADADSDCDGEVDGR